MTRVLVCGPAVFDDPLFVHNSLNEVNNIYGPISCIIHNNHLSAMLWQQWVAKRQDTRHLPIVLDMRDGTAKHDRCRDRMFVEGRPDFVVVFEIADRQEPGRDELSRLIVHRALDRGLPLATYAYMGGLRAPHVHGRNGRHTRSRYAGGGGMTLPLALLIEELGYIAEALERPTYRSLEVGFRHTPLRPKEIEERLYETCQFTAQDLRAILARLGETT